MQVPMWVHVIERVYRVAKNVSCDVLLANKFDQDTLSMHFL